jgi:hypothetical protein
LNLQSLCEACRTGTLPIHSLHMPCDLLSRIESMSSTTMETSSTKSSPRTSANIMPALLPLIRQSENVSVGGEACNSPILTVSQTSMKATSPSWAAVSMTKEAQVAQSADKELITAKDGTTKLAVDLIQPVTTSMCMQGAGARSTLKRTAPLVPPQTYISIKCPQYLQGMAWFIDESSFSLTAKSSLYATPLPSPGSHDFSDTALDSLNACPDLFAIVTPIRIDVFCELLQEHSNQLFVKSILEGLHEGFWQCADTTIDGYPLTWDNSYQPLKSKEH